MRKCNGGARLEVVQELGGGFPEVFPEIIGADDAKLGEVLGVFFGFEVRLRRHAEHGAESLSSPRSG